MEESETEVGSYRALGSAEEKAAAGVDGGHSPGPWQSDLEQGRACSLVCHSPFNPDPVPPTRVLLLFLLTPLTDLDPLWPPQVLPVRPLTPGAGPRVPRVQSLEYGWGGS